MIPSGLWSMTSLEELSLALCPVRGTIPTELTKLTKLKTLHLRASYVSGTLPAEIGQLGALTYLDLSATYVFGPIPLIPLSELPSLTTCYMGPTIGTYNTNVLAAPAVDWTCGGEVDPATKKDAVSALEDSDSGVCSRVWSRRTTRSSTLLRGPIVF